jgi:glycerophosphoryl diester phosphodiesterase
MTFPRRADVWCIAHRGASGREPENTLRAVRAALDLGVDAIEVDVHAVHGTLLVIHDARLERTTNGTGRLADHSLDELRQLDAGRGERIPTLEEVIDLVDGRVPLVIELKGASTAQPVVNLLRRRVSGGRNRVTDFLISSFDHVQIQEAQRLEPELRRALLLQGVPLGLAAFAEPLQPHSLHISHEFLRSEFIEDAHRRGFQVFVFTVDREDEWAELRRLGVDGVFTNYPELLIRRSAGETND